MKNVVSIENIQLKNFKWKTLINTFQLVDKKCKYKESLSEEKSDPQIYMKGRTKLSVNLK